MARAEVPGHPPFMVDRADVDISYAATAAVKFLRLLWRTEQRRPLGTGTMPDHAQITEER
ncbi:hypothetical protein ACFQ2B_40315 [Streptomyces stramineus]